MMKEIYQKIRRKSSPSPKKFEDWTKPIKAALTDNPTYWPDPKEYDEIVKECTDAGSYHVNKENVPHRAEDAEVPISEWNQALQHQVESIETDSTIAASSWRRQISTKASREDARIF
ncbi:unnamed protein product, partial [Mesorhabditis belari]|uniref:Uncharacterized protein n=1 Tax=Mesorhabditis belari TaxID=2138241 RepID=A0AAF3FS84_9BILA